MEVLSPVVWLQEPSAAKNARPTISEWKRFLRVRCNGKAPVDGVFQVDGRPVQPAIEWSFRGNTRVRNTPVVVGENQNGEFDLRIREPGRYTFIATVGKAWWAQVTIEAKPFPFERGLRKPAFLEKHGNPDATMPNGCLIYRRWTGQGIYERQGAGMQAAAIPAAEWQAALMGASADAKAIVLHSRSAKVVGSQTAYSEEIESTHDWYSVQEYLEWPVELPRGTYTVAVEYSSASHGAGSLFGVTLSRNGADQPSSSVSSTLENTNSRQWFVVRPMGTAR